MAKKAEKRLNRGKDGILISSAAVISAIILLSGIVTIGAMNLLATDDLYTIYKTGFTAGSIACGVVVFTLTAAVCAAAYFAAKSRAAVISVLAAAFLMRIAASLFWNIEPESDFLITYELSKLLAQTPLARWGAALDAYGTSYNSVWSAHMPFVVYQSLLLRLTQNAAILRISNAVFSFGSCFFLSETAKKLGGDRAYRLSLVFTSFNSAYIFMVPVLTNQHIAQFFFVLGVFLFFCLPRFGVFLRASLAGACVGISQLMRPEMWIVVIAAAIYVLYSELRGKKIGMRTAVFAVGLCVFFAVTAAMNAFLSHAGVIHRSIYRSNLNYKLLVGLNPETNGSWSASDSQLEGNDRAINTLIVSRIRSDPLSLIPRLYGKAVYQLGTYVYTWSYNGKSEWISQIIMRRSGAALMLIVCAIAAWKLIRRRRETLKWVYLALIGYAAFYALTEVQGRYSMSFIPLLVLIASI